MTQKEKQKMKEDENIFSWIDLTMKPFRDMADQLESFPMQDLFDFQKPMPDDFSQTDDKSSDFSKINDTVFNNFRENYIKHLHEFLNIPQLGLFKFHTEKTNTLIDKNILFQSYLSELLYHFYIPFEKAGLFIQKKMIREGINSDPKDNYNLWITELEKHFLDVLKSSEYTNSLKKVLDSLVCSREARDEVLTLIIDNLPIATSKEMDEAYKELYKTRKELNLLTKEIALLKNRGSKEETDKKNELSDLTKEIELLKKSGTKEEADKKKEIGNLTKEIEILKKRGTKEETVKKKELNLLTKEIEILKKRRTDDETDMKEVLSHLTKEIELLKSRNTDKEADKIKAKRVSSDKREVTSSKTKTAKKSIGGKKKVSNA